MSQPEIKIRTLPRGESKKKTPGKGTKVSGASAPKSVPRWLVYCGSVFSLALSVVFFLPQPHRPAVGAKTQPTREAAQTHVTELASVDETNVSRHLQESLVKQQMLRSRQRFENLELAETTEDYDPVMLENDSHRNLGLQFDTENTQERLYAELNPRAQAMSASELPDDRISARLANRKWVNQMERAERINFVRTFIRSAFDRGYQVDIDQNLVVVGVHKITGERKINIDQIIDRMAKQGL